MTISEYVIKNAILCVEETEKTMSGYNKALKKFRDGNSELCWRIGINAEHVFEMGWYVVMISGNWRSQGVNNDKI